MFNHSNEEASSSKTKTQSQSNHLNYSFRTFCNICKLPLKDNPYYDSNNLNL